MLTALAPHTSCAGDYALTVYAGQVTEEKWFDSLFNANKKFVDARILVGALAWTFKRYPESGISLEVEGQIGKYFGDQDHLEFNFPVAVRLHRLFWDSSVEASFAFGMGPSWASELPAAELQYNDSTRQFLVHWFLELTAGPADKDWAGVFRLHHRSSAFGLVAEEGGANILTAGVKYYFQ